MIDRAKLTDEQNEQICQFVSEGNIVKLGGNWRIEVYAQDGKRILLSGKLDASAQFGILWD